MNRYRRHFSAGRWGLAVALSAIAMTAAACGDDEKSSGGGTDTGAADTGAAAPKSTEPLGFAMLEGEAAEGAPDFVNGVNLAAEQINAAGGVEGRKIEVKTFKKGITVDKAVAAYREAAADPTILTAYIAGVVGTPAIGAQAIREKVPVFQQSGNRGLVEPPKPFMYSMSWDKEYPGTVVRWAVENKNTKKIAILHYETDYSSGITKSVEDRCKELGCEVTTSQSGELDASVDGLIPLLTKMKNSGADTYYIETLNPNGPKAARQLGMFDKPVISEQWLSVPAIAGAIGKAGEDIVFAAQKCVAPELATEGDPGAAFCTDYKAAYLAKYGEPYALFSIYGSDAVNLFADAARRLIKAGKEVTRETMNEAYEQFDGTLLTSHGKVESGPDQHHLTGPFEQGYLLYEIKVNGKEIKYQLAPNASADGAKP